MKLLVVYPYIPWPLDRGTYHRTYHLLRTLATEHQVDLLCLTENGERMEHTPVFEAFCNKVRFAPIEHPPWAKLADRLLSRTPTSVQHWDTPSARAAVATMLAQGSYDAAYVCDIVIAQFFLDQHQDIPLIIDRSRVDLLFQSTQRRLMSKGFLNRLNDLEAVFKTWLFERRIARRATLQIVCGPDDKTYIHRHISKTAPVHVLANGVDQDYFAPPSPATAPETETTPASPTPENGKRKTENAEPKTLLFCGAMDYTPNIDALRWYFSHIHTPLTQQVPDLQVLIVGKDPTPEVQAHSQQHSNVTITGSVPDVRPYYQRATVQMVPLRIGGGTRLKIVESLAIGTPVVSTTIGAQGLDLVHGQDLLLADTPSDFVHQLTRILQDSPLREHLRQHGRSTVLQRLTWHTLGQQLLRTLAEHLPQQAAQQPQQPQQKKHPICILGIPFDPITLSGTLAHIHRAITQPQKPQFIVTANVDFTLQSSTDPHLRSILHQADLVVCDGQPLVWASRLLGNPLPQRVAGSDLVPHLLAQAEQHGHSVYFLGGAPSVLQRAIQNIQQRHPRLKIAGHHSPPYQPLEHMDHAAICQQIRSAQPDILLVSFGCPKQEKWIHQHHHQLHVPISIGVGATIDFLAGAVARAPRWMQRTSLEWVWRLLQEPRRLLSRYTRGLLYFLPHITQQILHHQLTQLKHRLRPQPYIPPQQHPGHLHLPSHLTASTAADFLQRSQPTPQQPTTLHPSPLQHIDSTGLAILSRYQRDSQHPPTLSHPLPPTLQHQLQQHQLTHLYPAAPRTEPLHIAISTTVIQRGKSGVAQYVLALVRALCAEHQPSQHRISLFVLEEDLPLFSFTAGKVTLIPVAERHRSPIRNILWHQFQLPRLLQQHRIHLLHIPSYRRMLWSQRTPLVTTIHDLAQFQVRRKYDLPRMIYGRIVARILAHRQHQIIAISQNTAQDIQQHFHIPLSQQKVIYNGLDHTRFAPAAPTTENGERITELKRSESRQPQAARRESAANQNGERKTENGKRKTEDYFLYVSRIEHPAKNHLRLIDAFSQFKASTHSPAKLYLAGSDWHRADIVHQHAASSPHSADIRFLGFVPDADLPPLYHRAIALVYPSLFEGFGLPPVEAMASGCPVISSPSGSLAEVVGTAAHLIDPLDTTSIATALTRLATDPTHRQHLITAGLENARRFDWHQNARSLLRIYTDTAAAHRQRTPAQQQTQTQLLPTPC